MKNCFDCKHCTTFSLDLADRDQLKDYIDHKKDYIDLEPKSELIFQNRVGKCALGHNDKMKQFRDEHGSKTRKEIESDKTLEMDCHDYTDTVKILDKAIEKTKDLIKLLDNKENDRSGDNQI